MSGTEDKLAELVVGAYGWEHPAWLEAYYPDDLPEDWRLDYYANEFGCVVVPSDIWTSAEEESIQQWLEDVGDEFWFFLELPAHPEDIKAQLAVLGDRCAGLVMHGDRGDEWLPLAGDVPLLRSADEGDLRLYQSAGQGETVMAWLQAGPGEKIELPLLREQIELALRGVSATSQLAFIIGNEAPAMENLQNAKVVAELLGA